LDATLTPFPVSVRHVVLSESPRDRRYNGMFGFLWLFRPSMSFLTVAALLLAGSKLTSLARPHCGPEPQCPLPRLRSYGVRKKSDYSSFTSPVSTNRNRSGLPGPKKWHDLLVCVSAHPVGRSFLCLLRPLNHERFKTSEIRSRYARVCS